MLPIVMLPIVSPTPHQRRREDGGGDEGGDGGGGDEGGGGRGTVEVQPTGGGKVYSSKSSMRCKMVCVSSGRFFTDGAINSSIKSANDDETCGALSRQIN